MRFGILLLAFALISVGVAKPATAQEDDSCAPYTGGWIYQGMLQQRAQACQQQRQAVLEEQQRRRRTEPEYRAGWNSL
jgi:hypothetical protein